MIRSLNTQLSVAGKLVLAFDLGSEPFNGSSSIRTIADSFIQEPAPRFGNVCPG